VIEHKAVVSIIHLKQRRAGKTVVFAVPHEATTRDAESVTGIGEAYNGLLGDEWLHPEREAAPENALCSSSTAIFSEWEPAKGWTRAGIGSL
jgi:hypothetical protein